MAELDAEDDSLSVRLPDSERVGNPSWDQPIETPGLDALDGLDSLDDDPQRVRFAFRAVSMVRSSGDSPAKGDPSPEKGSDAATEVIPTPPGKKESAKVAGNTSASETKAKSELIPTPPGKIDLANNDAATKPDPASVMPDAQQKLDAPPKPDVPQPGAGTASSDSAIAKTAAAVPGFMADTGPSAGAEPSASSEPSVGVDIGAGSISAAATSSARIASLEKSAAHEASASLEKETADVPDAAKPPAYMDWAKPDLTLVFTGDQHGYLEPCGCTGLDRQKGGVARRFTFLKGLRDRGWELAPLDVGNQVRRFGVQAETKLRRTIEALNEMGYVTTGIGPDDVELGFQLLGAAQDIPLTSANVVLYAEEYSQPVTLIEKGGQRVAVSALLDPKSLNSDPSEDIVVGELKASAAKVAASGEVKTADFSVMMFYGDEDKAKQLMVDVPGFDLWVVSGGYGEPTFEPMKVEGTASRMILTGNKGMYAGLVGLSRNADFKYARVPLTHEFADAPEMRRLMADYQNELKQVGLEGLGLLPATPHLSGDKFVGSQTCGKCHTSAMEVWENSMHALATDDIVQPPEGRGDVARHFDPECLSCHVTGWNPQNYYPYESGYVSLEKSKPLVGNGCENCHGPGAAHSAAEMKGSGVAAEEIARLREAMKLPLSRAKEKCLECHDLDNSPDFHEPGAFEDVYWPEVEHYGKD